MCVIEKAATVGGHILSGAVIEPRSLNELIPDWQEKGAPLNTPVKSDKFLLLSETGSLGQIRFLCYVIDYFVDSLSFISSWLS